MTVGEKIQFYRKKSGLSQEELGRKMLVSRQTISLWEMDKTVPTVDNLLRLKDIFSVSADDILSDTDTKDQSASEPKESYTFKYEKTDFQEVYKKTTLPFLKLIALTALGWLSLFASLGAEKSNHTFGGFLLGVFSVMLVIQIARYVSHRKAWKGSESKLLQTTYSYEIFDGYFVVNLSKSGEITATQKILFENVEKVQDIENYLLLQISGKSYIIKKSLLCADSALLSLGASAPKKAANELTGRWSLISNLLFILSIFSIPGALFSTTMLSKPYQDMTENMWVFLLFLPIPIASIALGIYLKKKGYKYKLNVIVGVIIAALLCVFGSFSFLFTNVHSHSDEPILNAEQLLNIDIPQHSRIETQDWTKGTQNVPRGYIYSTSYIFFDDAAVEEFEKAILTDEKWISNIPSEMIGITSYYCDSLSSDRYLIYNKDTNEFNKIPSESGTYHFMNILYNVENNLMLLVEYQIEYTKN